jgi:hypothetical protein
MSVSTIKRMLNCVTERKRVKFLKNVVLSPIFNRIKTAILVLNVTQQHK